MSAGKTADNRKTRVLRRSKAAAEGIFDQTRGRLDHQVVALKAHQCRGIIRDRPVQGLEQLEVAVFGIEGGGEIEGNIGKNLDFIHVIQSRTLFSRGQQLFVIKNITVKTSH